MCALSIKFSDLYADKKDVPTATLHLQRFTNVLKIREINTLVLPHFSHIRVPFSLSLTYIFLTSIAHFPFLETTSTCRSHATPPCRPHAGSVPESHVLTSDGRKRMPT